MINQDTSKGAQVAGVAKVAFVIVALMAALMLQTACSSGSGKNASSGTAETAKAENATDTESASSYEVTIDDAVVTADYEGNPAIVVTFSWKNNSDEATSFAGALYPKCYQNGVQLDTAIVIDGIDSSGYMADVKPGSGTTVQMAYELTDETPVEVEVGELISLDKTVLASKTFEIA